MMDAASFVLRPFSKQEREEVSSLPSICFIHYPIYRRPKKRLLFLFCLILNLNEFAQSCCLVQRGLYFLLGC